MTVYVVSDEADCYDSDENVCGTAFRILGVYTDKNIADQKAKEVMGEVEEFSLDDEEYGIVYIS